MTLFLQIYHACDGPGLSILCFMRYDILEYFSVYGTALSMWVTLVGKTIFMLLGTKNSASLAGSNVLACCSCCNICCVFDFWTLRRTHCSEANNLLRLRLTEPLQQMSNIWVLWLVHLSFACIKYVPKNIFKMHNIVLTEAPIRN